MALLYLAKTPYLYVCVLALVCVLVHVPVPVPVCINLNTALCVFMSDMAIILLIPKSDTLWRGALKNLSHKRG